MEMGEGAPGLAIEPGEALMAVGAGALAIVAADAKLLVDQEDVGGLANPFRDQEAGDRGIHFDDPAEAILARLDETGELLARRHFVLHPREQGGLGGEQFLERIAVQLDHFGLDRRAHRGGAPATVDQRHLAEIGARRQIAQENRLAADILLDRHRALADQEDVIAFLVLGDDRLAGADFLNLGAFEQLLQILLARGADNCSSIRSVATRVISRLAAELVAISFSTALRGISITIAPEAVRTVAPRLRPEISPTSPTIEPCAIDAGARRILGVERDDQRPVGDRDQRIAGVVALEYQRAGRARPHFGIEHELAHLEHREFVQYRHSSAQERQHSVTLRAPGSALNLASRIARRRASARHCR